MASLSQSARTVLSRRCDAQRRRRTRRVEAILCTASQVASPARKIAPTQHSPRFPRGFFLFHHSNSLSTDSTQTPASPLC